MPAYCFFDVLEVTDPEKLEKAQLAALKAVAEEAERRRGVKISKECLDNPIAPGCQ